MAAAVVPVGMEPTARLTGLLVLTLLGCAAGSTPESEFADSPSPTAAAAPAAPVSTPDRIEAARTGGQEFQTPTPTTSAPRACVADEEPFAGCFIDHDVGPSTLASDVSMTCGDDAQASNGCSAKPLSFEFVHEWAKRPNKLSIAFDTAYFCAAGGGLLQVVELNGKPVGTFEGNRSDCTCGATSKERVIEVPGSSLGMLKPGLMNRVSIVGPNRCLALRPKAEWRGAYARVTTTY